MLVDLLTIYEEGKMNVLGCWRAGFQILDLDHNTNTPTRFITSPYAQNLRLLFLFH